MSITEISGGSDGDAPSFAAGGTLRAVVEVMSTPVRLLMGLPIPAVHAGDSVMTAARKLRAHATDAVPVHGDHGRYLGMLTRAAIVDECVAAGQNPGTLTAATLITTPGPFVRPEQDAGSSVVELILQHRASLLPVVEDGRLVGIITLDAIAGHLVANVGALGDSGDFGHFDSFGDASDFGDTGRFGHSDNFGRPANLGHSDNFGRPANFGRSGNFGNTHESGDAVLGLPVWDGR